MDNLSDEELDKAETPHYSSRHVVDDWCRRLAAEVRYERRRAVKHAIERSSVGHVPMEQYTRLLAGCTTLLKTLEDATTYGIFPKPFRNVVDSVLHKARELIGQA